MRTLRHAPTTLSLLALACSSAKSEPALDDALTGSPGGAGSAPMAAGSSGSAGSAAGASSSVTAGSGGAQGPAPAGTGAGAGAMAEPPPPRADAGAALDGGDASAPMGTGPGDWIAGDYPPDLGAETYLEISGVPGQGDRVRQYKVHLPPSYDPAVPAPAVFCIHGLGQTAVLFCITGTAMHEKSDEAGFVLIMPNGYQNSWNAGTCCGGASSEQLDDVALFRAIFDEVGKHVNIDRSRVYATGLSNGGYMSYRLACEAADLFTAVAPNAAAIGKNDIGGGTNGASDFTVCEPSRPIPLLAVHGTDDPLIPYSLVAPSIAHLANEYGCAAESEPAAYPQSAGDTTCVRRTGCPAGIELVTCTIEGGGHCWFGSPDCGTGGGAIGMAIVGANSDTMISTDAVWGFFERVGG